MQSKKRLFDYESLESELGTDNVVMLARLFYEDTRGILPRLQQSLADKDQEGARKLVHMLKGCCRSIAAMPVEEFCEVLEDAATTGDWTSVKVGMSALGPLYSSLTAELAGYLEMKTQAGFTGADSE